MSAISGGIGNGDSSATNGTEDTPQRATSAPPEGAMAAAEASLTFEYRPTIDSENDTLNGDALTDYRLYGVHDEGGLVIVTIETPEPLAEGNIEADVYGDCDAGYYSTTGWYRDGAELIDENIQSGDFMLVHTNSDTCILRGSLIRVMWDGGLSKYETQLGRYRTEGPPPTTSNASHVTPEKLFLGARWSREGAQFTFKYENINDYRPSPYNMTAKIIAPNGDTFQQTESFDGFSKRNYITVKDEGELTDAQLENSTFQLIYEDELVWELDGCDYSCEYEDN